jgi:hypothetical protein
MREAHAAGLREHKPDGDRDEPEGADGESSDREEPSGYEPL